MHAVMTFETWTRGGVYVYPASHAPTLKTALANFTHVDHSRFKEDTAHRFCVPVQETGKCCPPRSWSNQIRHLVDARITHEHQLLIPNSDMKPLPQVVIQAAFLPQSLVRLA